MGKVVDKIWTEDIETDFYSENIFPMRSSIESKFSGSNLVDYSFEMFVENEDLIRCEISKAPFTPKDSSINIEWFVSLIEDITDLEKTEINYKGDTTLEVVFRNG